MELLETQVKGACPACESLELEPIGSDSGATVVSIEGRLCELAGYQVRRCMACDLYFKSVAMSNSSLARYYSTLDFQVFERDERFPTDRAAHETLRRVPDSGRVLDFGCSTGRILKRETSRLRCFGVEPNRGAAQVAEERGIRIVDEQSLFAGIHGQFDLVILADVYEHLPSPVELLTRLKKLIAPGGSLVIITGNADAIRHRDWIGEHWYFRIEGHLQMMTVRHANWVAARLGMQVENIVRCSHYRLSMLQRLRQHSRSFAYFQFKEAPRSAVSALLRRVPIFSRAEYWPNAPVLSCGADHLVATMRNASGGSGR